MEKTNYKLTLCEKKELLEIVVKIITLAENNNSKALKYLTSMGSIIQEIIIIGNDDKSIGDK